MDYVQRYALLGTLVITVMVFSMLLPGRFSSAVNMRSIVANQIVVLIMALGVLFPLAMGEFDMSVGSVVGFSQVIVIGMMAKSGLPIPAAILIALAVSSIVGLVNGLVLTRLRAGSFIATLSTGSVITGLTYWYTGGQTIFAGVPERFTALGRSQFWGIPVPVFYALVLAVTIGVFFTFTRAGRRMYATGDNPRAAVLVGINVRRMTLLAFIISALMAGLAGVIIASQLGSGDPTLGPDLLLPAYAGPLLGATAFHPGRYNVPGTVVAIYLLASVAAGLEIYGVPSWSTYVFNGLALVIAVGLSNAAADMRAARARRSRLRALARATREGDSAAS
jgi:ribose transport system permease protein